MVVGVFIARGDAKDPTGKDLCLWMSGVERIAWIGDRLVDASDQIEPAIDSENVVFDYALSLRSLGPVRTLKGDNSNTYQD